MLQPTSLHRLLYFLSHYRFASVLPWALMCPLFSGIIAGMVGGIVIGFLSGSSLSISGPAAGLTAIVAVAVGKMPAYEAFLLSVVIAGILQIILGFLRAGVIGDYIPNSVILGMLASIGIVLILKQIPHLIGYDADYSGDDAFIQINKKNTFSELINSVNNISPFALMIGMLSIFILLIWDRPNIKKKKLFKNLPGPLVVVVVDILINVFFGIKGTRFSLSANPVGKLTGSNQLFFFHRIIYVSKMGIY